MLDVDLFRAAMARTASTVGVVTTDGPAGRRGVTVSSMCSLSLEPPSVLACVHHLSPACSAIAENGVFCANLLADDQRAVSESFAGRIPAWRGDKFACAQWQRLTTGSPALEDALAIFDCELDQVVRYGTHDVLMGRVVEVRMHEGRPLLYADRCYRRVA